MVSFSYTAMIVALLMGGLLLGLLAVPINSLTDSLNNGIDSDNISDQTRASYAWSVNMFKVILPMMILFSAIVWGYTQANMGSD